jgi:hypothetical protein
VSRLASTDSRSAVMRFARLAEPTVTLHDWASKRWRRRRPQIPSLSYTPSDYSLVVAARRVCRPLSAS